MNQLGGGGTHTSWWLEAGELPGVDRILLCESHRAASQTIETNELTGYISLLKEDSYVSLWVHQIESKSSF